MFQDYDSKRTLASWALRYVGTLPGVKVILSGMSTLVQVKDNLKTFENYQNLNDEEMAIVEKVADTLHARTKNGCTGCGYCMPCPFWCEYPFYTLSIGIIALFMMMKNYLKENTKR